MMLTRTLSMKRRELRERLQNDQLLHSCSPNPHNINFAHDPLNGRNPYGEVFERQYQMHLQEQQLKRKLQIQQQQRQQQLVHEQQPRRNVGEEVSASQVYQRQEQQSPMFHQMPLIGTPKKPPGLYPPYQKRSSDSSDDNESDIENVLKNSLTVNRLSVESEVAFDGTKDDEALQSDNDSLVQILGRSTLSQRPHALTSVATSPAGAGGVVPGTTNSKWPQQPQKQQQQPNNVLLHASDGDMKQVVNRRIPAPGAMITILSRTQMGLGHAAATESSMRRQGQQERESEQPRVVSPLTFDGASIQSNAKTPTPSTLTSPITTFSPIHKHNTRHHYHEEEKRADLDDGNALNAKLNPSNPNASFEQAAVRDEEKHYLKGTHQKDVELPSLSDAGSVDNIVSLDSNSLGIKNVMSDDVFSNSTAIGTVMSGTVTATATDDEGYYTDYDDTGIVAADNNTVRTDPPAFVRDGGGRTDTAFYKEQADTIASGCVNAASMATAEVLPKVRQLIVDVGDLPSQHVKDVVLNVLGNMQERFTGQGQAASSFWKSPAENQTKRSTSTVANNDNGTANDRHGNDVETMSSNSRCNDDVAATPPSTPEKQLIPPRPKARKSPTSVTMFDCNPFSSCDGDDLNDRTLCGDNEDGTDVTGSLDSSKRPYQMTSVIDVDVSLDESASSVFLSYQPSVPAEEDGENIDNNIRRCRKMAWKRKMQKLLCICGKRSSKNSKHQTMLNIPVVEPHDDDGSCDDGHVSLTSSNNGDAKGIAVADTGSKMARKKNSSPPPALPIKNMQSSISLSRHDTDDNEVLDCIASWEVGQNKAIKKYRGDVDFFSDDVTGDRVQTPNHQHGRRGGKDKQLGVVQKYGFLDEPEDDADSADCGQMRSARSKTYKIKLLLCCVNKANKRAISPLKNEQSPANSSNSISMKLVLKRNGESDENDDRIVFDGNNGRKPADPTSIILPLSSWASRRRNKKHSSTNDNEGEEMSTLLRSVAISASTPTASASAVSQTTECNTNSNTSVAASDDDDDAVSIEEVVELVFFDPNPSLSDDDEVVNEDRRRKRSSPGSALGRSWRRKYPDVGDEGQSNMKTGFENPSPSKLETIDPIAIPESQNDDQTNVEDFSDPAMTGAPQRNEQCNADAPVGHSCQTEVDESIVLTKICRSTVETSAPSMKKRFDTVAENSEHDSVVQVSAMNETTKKISPGKSIRISVLPVEKNTSTTGAAEIDNTPPKKRTEQWLDKMRSGTSVLSRLSNLTCSTSSTSTINGTKTDVGSSALVPPQSQAHVNDVRTESAPESSLNRRSPDLKMVERLHLIAPSSRPEEEKETNCVIHNDEHKPWETKRVREIRERMRRVQEARERRNAALATSSAQLRQNRRDDLHLFSSFTEAYPSKASPDDKKDASGSMNDDYSERRRNRKLASPHLPRPLSASPTSFDTSYSGLLISVSPSSASSFSHQQQQPEAITSATRLAGNSPSRIQDSWSR